MEQIFSCRTAANHYSYSEAYFRKLLKLKQIPSIKIGYNTRMKKSDLDAHFEAKVTEQRKKENKKSPETIFPKNSIRRRRRKSVRKDHGDKG